MRWLQLLPSALVHYRSGGSTSALGTWALTLRTPRPLAAMPAALIVMSFQKQIPTTMHLAAGVAPKTARLTPPDAPVESVIRNEPDCTPWPSR